MKTKFKDTEIGMIPEDWGLGTLKDITIFSNGKSSPERTDRSTFKVFGSNGVIGKCDQFNSQEGTIIIGRVGSYCGSVYYSIRKCWVTDNAIIGRARNNSDSKFIYYLLKRLQLNRHRGGSGQPLLNQAILNSIKTPIIEKNEQVEIAKILSDLDSKIELLQKQNKTLEDIAQALFKHWFVDFEFPDEEGKPYKSSGGEMVFNEELGKEIPRGWKVKNLGEFLNVIKGCSYKSEDLKESDKALITLKSINRDGGFNQKGYKEYVGDYKEEQIVKDGDIVVAQTDLTQAAEVIGTPAIVNSLNRYNELIASLDLQILRIKEKLNKGFAYFLLKTAMFHNHALSYTNGTTVLHLNKNAVPDFKFTLPNEYILGKFGKIAEQILEKGDKNEKEVYILSQIRDSLLPKLMSGKIRVLNNQKIKEAV